MTKMTKMATSDRPHGTALLLIWIAFGIYKQKWRRIT